MALELDPEAKKAIYSDPFVELHVSMDDGGISLGSYRMLEKVDRHEVQGGHLVVMSALLEGVLSTVNPVSASFVQRLP